MFIIRSKKVLITLSFLFIQANIVCFHNNRVNLNSTPFYSFLNEVEENKVSKEQIFLIKKLLTQTMSSVNKRKVYYNPKIKAYLLDILQRLDKFENIKPRDIRRFQKIVSDFDLYLIQYIDNLGFFLNRNDKEFLGGIRLFNNQAKNLLEDQSFLKFTILQKAEDFIFFRPLELVFDNKGLFVSLFLISGALISSLFFGSRNKKTEKKSDSLDVEKIIKEEFHLSSNNKSFNVLQIPVNMQKEAECALHAVWNCCLGLISNSVEQFKENEQKFSNDFEVWVKKIRENFEIRNWFDDGVIEKIISTDILLPDFVKRDDLENVRILRALPNGSKNFLKMHKGRFGQQDVDEDVYSSVVAAEFNGSLESFAKGDVQNLILLIDNHYVSLKLLQNNGELESWVTNSLGNENYINNYGVNNVVNYYMNTL